MSAAKGIVAEIDEVFMRLALKQAMRAFDAGEIPVGAVLVLAGKPIAQAYNQTETLKDPTAHAEILAITAACHQLQTKYLQGATLYVTLEPCVMCVGAIKWAQIGRLVYGASDTKAGFLSFTQKGVLPAKVEVQGGILETECKTLMLNFFKNLRSG